MSAFDLDFVFPLTMEVYYPIITQGGYGNVEKQWVLDQVLPCDFGPAGLRNKKDLQTDINVMLDNAVVGRVKTDITSSSRQANNSLTNILIANIKDANGNLVYNESAGVRAGKSTLFEIATLNPIVGPFHTVDYYKIILRRSENQAADI